MDFLVPQRKYTGALREILSRAVRELSRVAHPRRSGGGVAMINNIGRAPPGGI